MKIDIGASLNLAFRSLDLFSIPRIGTFRKVYHSAVVNHKEGRIEAPSEGFAFEEGEEYVSALDKMIRKSMDLQEADSSLMVQDLSVKILAALEARGRYEIPGIGELVKTNLGVVELRALENGFGNTFGLIGVPFTLRDAEESKEVKNEKRVQEAIKATYSVPVEPIEPVRKKRNLVPVFILVAFIGVTVSLILFRHQLGELFIPKETVVFASNDTIPVTDPMDIIPADTNALASTLKPEIKKDPVVKTEPIQDFSDSEEVGVSPRHGMHYLVVSSPRDAGNAAKYAARLSQQGFSAQVVKPWSRGGYYKVAVFSATDKASVIVKMVETKDKFPEKSWIFSP